MVAFAAGIPIPAVSQLEVQTDVNIIGMNDAEAETIAAIRRQAPSRARLVSREGCSPLLAILLAIPTARCLALASSV